MRVSGLMPSGSSVGSHVITSDSRYVVYIAAQETVGVSELFATAIDGGTPMKLNAPLPAGGDISGFQISPDGQLVVYRADQ